LQVVHVRRWLWGVPVAATLVGAANASAHGVSVGAFLPNVVALLGGCAGFLWLTRARRDQPAWLPAALLVAVAATLVAPGIAGVHRWLPLGPLRVNASAALAPWLLLALADADRARRWGAVAAAVGVQAVHLVQPDAAQATALALGALPLLLGRVGNLRVGITVAAILLGLAAAAWSRPDPLPALPHVERVLSLTVARGPLWAAAGALATAALFAPALLGLRGSGHGVGAGAALYLAGQLGATFVGNYPVPVLGAGAGPVLGWWGLAAICHARAR
jgi:cell division protein FtsW (lipid II flippase)